LVIDDDPHIRELVSALLDNAGFACKLAEDGRQGLRILGESLIDACVVDEMMPEMTGWSFAAWLVAITPTCRC